MGLLKGHSNNENLGALCAQALRGLALIALLAGALRAQTASEYELKAAFLYKFASFVVWPAGSGGLPLCIGVIGQDPFGADLDRVVQGKTVNGRLFHVHRYKALQDVEACQIVFIASSERGRLHSILERMRGMPILTVGDVPEFCEDGGIINLHVVGDRVRLQINLEAAERANLQLSSKLLNLASVFRGGSSMGSR